jgi:hypothetical protein
MDACQKLNNKSLPARTLYLTPIHAEEMPLAAIANNEDRL